MQYRMLLDTDHKSWVSGCSWGSYHPWETSLSYLALISLYTLEIEKRWIIQDYSNSAPLLSLSAAGQHYHCVLLHTNTHSVELKCIFILLNMNSERYTLAHLFQYVDRYMETRTSPFIYLLSALDYIQHVVVTICCNCLFFHLQCSIFILFICVSHFLLLVHHSFPTGSMKDSATLIIETVLIKNMSMTHFRTSLSPIPLGQKVLGVPRALEDPVGKSDKTHICY